MTWDVPDYPPAEWRPRRPPLGRTARVLLAVADTWLVIAAGVALLIGAMQLGEAIDAGGRPGHPVVGVLLLAAGVVFFVLSEALHRVVEPNR